MTKKKEIYDPIITFGKYKVEGLKLSEIPSDYLEWLKKPTDEGEDFHHRSVNWAQLARFELDRRLKGAPLMTRRVVEMPIEEDGAKKPKIKDSAARIKSDLVTVNIEAMDLAADYLLRDFIVRDDKELTLSNWLIAYVKEVARYGRKRAVDVVSSDIEIVIYHYRQLEYRIRVAPARITLVSIEKAEDDISE